MRVDKKQARQLAKLAVLLSNVGVTVDVEKIQEDAKLTPVTESNKLEGVLASIRRPGDFTYRRCIRCNEPFGSNYISVGYCSDFCRIKSFEQLTGVKWSSTKSPEERWGGEPPLVIPPDVVRRMLRYSEIIVEYARSQGWASVEDIPEPVFLDQSSTESDQPTPDPTPQSNGHDSTISFVQPAQTMEFEIVLPEYLGDGY
jgi:hypothetical protein